jgi:hypothetical protein
MNKKIIIFGIIILLFFIYLSGCINNNDNDGPNRPIEFVGTWVNKVIPSINFTLTNDGEYSWGVTHGGTWEEKEGKLVLEIDNYRTEFDFVFINNTQELQLTTSGNTITYIKQ